MDLPSFHLKFQSWLTHHDQGKTTRRNLTGSNLLNSHGVNFRRSGENEIKRESQTIKGAKFTGVYH